MLKNPGRFLSASSLQNGSAGTKSRASNSTPEIVLRDCSRCPTNTSREVSRSLGLRCSYRILPDIGDLDLQRFESLDAFVADLVASDHRIISSTIGHFSCGCG